LCSSPTARGSSRPPGWCKSCRGACARGGCGRGGWLHLGVVPQSPQARAPPSPLPRAPCLTPLLRRGAKKVVAADLNPRQNACVRLRACVGRDRRHQWCSPRGQAPAQRQARGPARWPEGGRGHRERT
jgi:hypothetical protein